MTRVQPPLVLMRYALITLLIVRFQLVTADEATFGTHRSTGDLTKHPGCERAPLMQQIEDLNKEKVRRHISQDMVLL